MLTLLSKAMRSGQFCDGLSRRDFLSVGGSIAGGLSLSSLLQAEAQQGVAGSHKSLINIFLPGGPPHQDLWDLKPDAPDGIRGEFKPINTNVPGIQICELLPKLAAIMDKLVVIRSIVGARGPHYAEQCMSPTLVPGSPSLGAWVARLEGPARPEMPPNLSMCYRTSHRPWGEAGGGGFLGAPYAPYGLVEKYDPGHKAATTADLAPDPGHLVLKDVSLAQLQNRKALLTTLNRWQTSIVKSAVQQERQQFVEQAWSILASPTLAEALDVSREDPKIVERYGPGVPVYKDDSAPRITENFLRARRLVEAGARVVSLNFSRWDWHGNCFKQGREEFPMLDNAVSALVQDLHERGLDRDVTVIVWGEFGRTPTINQGAGRDHWPRVNSALLAGGGMTTGQVIGATDNQAGEVIDRPVTFGDVHATLLHNLGIDGHGIVYDAQNRPHRPLDADSQPIAELIG
ncbi:MAG: DUF1501 domain-containing protein [Planctomycetales bacterium]|nr:DUF1501 domain-containing protein [Planctomycetales bacterium]